MKPEIKRSQGCIKPAKPAREHATAHGRYILNIAESVYGEKA